MLHFSGLFISTSSKPSEDEAELADIPAALELLKYFLHLRALVGGDWDVWPCVTWSGDCPWSSRVVMTVSETVVVKETQHEETDRNESR